MALTTPRDLAIACDRALEIGGQLFQVYIERCLDLDIPPSVALAIFSALMKKQVEGNLEAGALRQFELEMAEMVIQHHPGASSDEVIAYARDGSKERMKMSDVQNRNQKAEASNAGSKTD